MVLILLIPECQSQINGFEISRSNKFG